ncbi:MAG: hypothetical protein JWQ07_4414 [Ramlibacter sp.]|nr:hypothetical protein [Ramlibacter sp.]
MNWFFASGGQVPAMQRQHTELIRSAMLEALEALACPAARALMLRILCAGDAERLWYLRPEAMSVLASHQGEALARQTLARISVLFRDVLPEGLASQLRASGPANTPARYRRLEILEETS